MSVVALVSLYVQELFSKGSQTAWALLERVVVMVGFPSKSATNQHDGYTMVREID